MPLSHLRQRRGCNPKERRAPRGGTAVEGSPGLECCLRRDAYSAAKGLSALAKLSHSHGGPASRGTPLLGSASCHHAYHETAATSPQQCDRAFVLHALVDSHLTSALRVS
jgi:hypothetical protein